MVASTELSLLEQKDYSSPQIACLFLPKITRLVCLHLEILCPVPGSYLHPRGHFCHHGDPEHHGKDCRLAVTPLSF